MSYACQSLVSATLRHSRLSRVPRPSSLHALVWFFSQFNALFYAAYFMCCVAPAAFCSFHAHFVARTRRLPQALTPDPLPLTRCPQANAMFKQGVKKRGT